MKIDVALLLLAFVACGGASNSPTVSAPTVRGYVIRVQTPTKVGDRWHVVADDETTEHTSAQVANQPMHVDSGKTIHVHADGTIEVLELQTNGRSPLKDEMTVREFWTTVDQGGKQVLASPGARVAVGRSAKKADAVVTVDGAAASQAVRDALDAVFSLTTYDGPSDDDVFGNQLPQTIGSEWPINGPLAEKSLAASGVIVSPGALTGTMKLVGVQSKGGHELLELTSKLSVGALQSIGSLPPGSTIESAKVEVSAHMLVPTERGPAMSQSEMTMTIVGTVTVPSAQGPVRVTLDSIKRASSVRESAAGAVASGGGNGA